EVIVLIIAIAALLVLMAIKFCSSEVNCCLIFAISDLAKLSHPLFFASPACPCTHLQERRCFATSASNACQSSSFLTLFRALVLHPCAFHPLSHFEIPLQTYCESLKRRTSHGSFNARRASTIP